ncbi:MAG: TetR/AcrR family transcriptional regulator [Casimicrobiaceae bacterium]
MARNYVAAAAAVVPVRPQLSRERIVAAALTLIDRDGLAAFSIRGLGAALGCEPMSIYHYFQSKAYLLDALVDDALASVLTDPRDADPFDRLRALARSWRSLAHRHPNLFPLIAVHRLDTPIGVRFIEQAVRLVHAAIPDDRLAAQYFRVLGYFVTGAALDETACDATGPSAAEGVDGPEWRERVFELGLESLLDAMRAASPAIGILETESLPAPKPVIRPKR